MASTTLNGSTSWICFDSGATSVSRGHLEETIINHAKKLGCDLELLVSYQLTLGLRRVAFVIASQDEKALKKLERDLSDYFPSFSGQIERQTLIESCKTRQSGRVVVATTSTDISGVVSARFLTKSGVVDRVIAIGEELPKDAQINVNGFLRPMMAQGELQLMVERVDGGLFAPIERQGAHECCGGHEAEAPISLGSALVRTKS